MQNHETDNTTASSPSKLAYIGPVKTEQGDDAQVMGAPNVHAGDKLGFHLAPGDVPFQLVNR